jgi:hypothetical protein
MEIKKDIFTQEDFVHFKKWIGPYCSQEGKYAKQFEEFWELFFKDGETLSSLLGKFKSVKTTGTLSSWFSFIGTKLICYSFIFKEMSLGEISQESGYPISKIATMLRNFFVETFPYLENYFNEVFHLTRKRKDLLFQDLVNEKKFSKNFPGVQDEDIMKGLDVGSLQDWPILVKSYKRKYHSKNTISKKLSPKTFFKKNSKIFIEVFFLIIGGVLLIRGTANINKWYERKLVERINIFEIQSPKIKNDLSIGKESSEIIEKPTEPEQNLDEIVKTETEEKPDLAFDDESEVILTSWKTLPKDFGETNSDKSDYEEETNTAARDITSGNKKVYRVIMESVSPGKTKTEIDNLLLKFNGTQVDSVKPGTYVPGGLYYNVLVPQEKIKEFLYHVMNTDEATLYETRTRLENPPGKGRVFIWIKVF